MPKTTITQDERQLIKLVEKLPFTDEERQNMIGRIQNKEMSEELAEEIRQKLASHESGSDQDAAARTRHLVELAGLVKRWRLSNQSQNFRRR